MTRPPALQNCATAQLSSRNLFRDSGGRLLFGTDVGYALSACGLGVDDVLAMLTTRPAEAFGTGAGTIAPGGPGDLVLLNKLATVTDLASVRATGRAGQVTWARDPVLGAAADQTAALPGGIVHQTPWWVVNHVVGAMNLGTLIVGPREHVTAVADLNDDAVSELGLVLRDTARVIETLCRPEQTYVCLWSHDPQARKHLHFAVQPVTAELVARYGGLRSEQLQARIMASGDEPLAADVERVCDRARELFATIR